MGLLLLIAEGKFSRKDRKLSDFFYYEILFGAVQGVWGIPNDIFAT